MSLPDIDPLELLKEDLKEDDIELLVASISRIPTIGIHLFAHLVFSLVSFLLCRCRCGLCFFPLISVGYWTAEDTWGAASSS